ncbi:MAG TPA: glycerate kinase [Gaiellaceae bacterium]|nr:glycerate kinase [Gaiellaceae bacterium]
MRLLASPASLKGVLSAVEAASALAGGMRRGGAEAVELPVADGGEGTAEVLAGVLGGAWRSAEARDPFGRRVEARYLVLDDGTAIVECAEAVGLGLLAPGELDPLRASSAGLGELLSEVLAGKPAAVVVCLGGSATVDGGAGLLSSLAAWPADVPLRVACDVRNPLLGERGATRVYGPQKGASPEAVEELERRLRGMEALRPYRDLPGAGAAGGLGAALACLGGELVAGAELVLDLIGFDDQARGAALVVTGEGTVDESTFEGKAPGTVRERCERLGTRVVLFGGQVTSCYLDAVDVRPLSGRPERAREDLRALGEELALALMP